MRDLEEEPIRKRSAIVALACRSKRQLYWWKGCLLYENKSKKTSESHDTPLYNLP